MGWTAKPGQLLGVEQTLVLSSLFVSMEMRDLGINGGKKEQKRGRGGKGSIHEGLLGGKEPSLLNLCPETGSSVLWEMLHLGYQTHEGWLPGAWLQSVSVTTLLWFATPLWRWGGVYQSPELPEDLWELSAHQTASGFGEEEILLCFSSSLVVTPAPPPRPASCPVDIWSFICMVYLVSCFRTVPPLLQIICFDRIFLEAPLLDKVQSLQGLAWKIWICTVHRGLLSDLRLLLLPWYGLFFPSWALRCSLPSSYQSFSPGPKSRSLVVQPVSTFWPHIITCVSSLVEAATSSSINGHSCRDWSAFHRS